MRARRLSAWLPMLLLAACGGGGSGSGATIAPATSHLTVPEVERIVAQAVGEAQARGIAGQIAVVDRVGNLLAMFEMTGAVRTLEVTSGLGITGGLDGVSLPAPYAQSSAISKAVTAAYLSSGGNAFSTRTAGQIVQEHFNPQEDGQPSGPLYGVQFSQLRCSDVIRTVFQGQLGPKPSPFGLSGDPGGLPLYKDGVLVGAVGVEVNGRYSLDRDITDRDADDEERVAWAGSQGFAAPQDIRGNRITADGRTLRFIDSEDLASDPARAPAFAALPGRLTLALGFSFTEIREGASYGTPASGIRPVSEGGSWIVVDGANANRYPPVAGVGMTAQDADVILAEALAVARRTRAQIRRPLGSSAEVTIAVVDLRGDILGLVRTPDAPVFGLDVAVQKARTASFFSQPGAATILGSLGIATSTPPVDVSHYLGAARSFLGDPQAFTGGTAWSARALGNLHRPTFPDGLAGTPHGPFSTPMAQWSPFNPGFQLDLVFNQLVQSALNVVETKGCSMGAASLVLANGVQIFPGGVPIYRGGAIVGAIGVSGDGVDQDDMVAFLGLHNAGVRLGNGIGNAPAAMRADRLTPQGTRLRYVQCPQAPFLDSDTHDACAGK